VKQSSGIEWGYFQSLTPRSVSGFAPRGNTSSWPGKFLAAGKLYDGRLTIINQPDTMSILIKAEISPDGKTWVPFIESK
jgi:hypothetical protein